MLQCSFVQRGQGASDAIYIGDVVAKSDDVIARNRDALGGVDVGWRSWTRVRRGTGCVLTGSNGKDGGSKENKSLHEISPRNRNGGWGGVSIRLVPMEQFGWGLSMTNPRHQ